MQLCERARLLPKHSLHYPLIDLSLCHAIGPCLMPCSAMDVEASP
jgi:hypothetical protein